MQLSPTLILLTASVCTAAQPVATEPARSTKQSSTLYPPAIVQQLRDNAARDPWAAGVRDSLVKAAKPLMDNARTTNCGP